MGIINILNEAFSKEIKIVAISVMGMILSGLVKNEGGGDLKIVRDGIGRGHAEVLGAPMRGL